MVNFSTICSVSYDRHTFSLMLYQENDVEEELKEAFKVFDKDQNGFISATEVTYAPF